jgi:hypothetical protein
MDSSDGSADFLKSKETIVFQDFGSSMDVLYQMLSIPHVFQRPSRLTLSPNSIAYWKVLITNASVATESVQLLIDSNVTFKLRTTELAIPSNSID